jgi:hypothetical protein
MPGWSRVLGRVGRFAGRAARRAGGAARFGGRTTGTALERYTPRHAWDFSPEWFHANRANLGGFGRARAGGAYSGFWMPPRPTGAAFNQNFTRRGPVAGALMSRNARTGRMPWSNRRKLMVGGAGVLGAALLYSHQNDKRRNSGMQYYY